LNFQFQNKYYEIHNYDFIEPGEISVSDAMAESDNTVFVQLAADVGLNDVVETAKSSASRAPSPPTRRPP
jgi:penicillin-binding protein 1A